MKSDKLKLISQILEGSKENKMNIIYQQLDAIQNGYIFTVRKSHNTDSWKKGNSEQTCNFLISNQNPPNKEKPKTKSLHW